MSEHFDVVIIGGAVMGSATAMFVAANPAWRGRVLVLEKDPSYRRAASALSTSGVRQQFSSSVNIRLSQFTEEFLHDADFHFDQPLSEHGVGLHEAGYLYLDKAHAVPIFESNHRLQRSCGVDVVLLDPSALSRRFPWLTVDDIAVGSLGLRGEGWIDGYLLMSAFKRRARALGVEYRDAEATGLELAHGRVTAVCCADGSRIVTNCVVNAAGGSGGAVARMAGIALPIRNVKQAVFVFESSFRAEGMPFVLDPEGLFVRPEGREFIAGLGIGDDAPEADDFEVDHRLFEERMWPLLAARIQGFENARFKGAWAGHYDMNLFDHNAIIGAVPGVEGFLLANGFSGHGLMHAPGIGRALSELIVHGEFRSIDLSELSFDRIAAQRPLRERIQY